MSDKTRQSMLTVHCQKKKEFLKRKKTGRAAWVKGIEEDYIYFESFPSILPPLLMW